MEPRIRHLKIKVMASLVTKAGLENMPYVCGCGGFPARSQELDIVFSGSRQFWTATGLDNILFSFGTES